MCRSQKFNFHKGSYCLRINMDAYQLAPLSPIECTSVLNSLAGGGPPNGESIRTFRVGPRDFRFLSWVFAKWTVIIRVDWGNLDSVSLLSLIAKNDRQLYHTKYVLMKSLV